MSEQYYRKSFSHQNFKFGVSLIEVVLALALFSVILVVVFGGQWAAGDAILNNARTLYATNVAHEKIMAVLLSDTLGTDRNSRTSEVRDERGLLGVLFSLTIKPFTRCGKVVESRFAWLRNSVSTSTLSHSVLLPKLGFAKDIGNDCGGNPKKYFDSGFEMQETVELGAPTASVDIFRNYAFVGLRPVLGQPDSAPDLKFISLTTPSEEISFDIPGVSGVNKVDAVEGYVFTANNSSSAQLATVRIVRNQGAGQYSDIASVELLATSTLPGVTGARPEAVSIFYADSKIYIGTKRTAGHEFHIFDVSDLAMPHWLGSREMNHNINDIVVKDGYAFLATSGNVRDLFVLDIRDPARVTEAVTIDLPGNEDGRSVQISANYVFLGRHKATQPGHNELCVLRYWFNSVEGRLEMDLIGSASTAGDVVGISVAAGYVFTTTSNALREFQVFDFNLENGLAVLQPVGNRNINFAAVGIDTENQFFVAIASTGLILFGQQ